MPLIFVGYLIIGGCNVRQLDPVWFRKHIGLVNQEPILFASSIADNISYGREGALKTEVLFLKTYLSSSS